MTEDKKIFATPKVRKFARELGANVSQIKGTERKDRITEEDVKNFIRSQVTVNQGAIQKKETSKYVEEYPHEEFGEVLVKVSAAGLCHSDLSVVNGNRPRVMPMVLGHEGSGIVIKVGSSVNKFQIGDEVILTWIKCEGLEEQGTEYLSQGEIINSGPVTTFSNYSVVSENRIIKKKKRLLPNGTFTRKTNNLLYV